MSPTTITATVNGVDVDRMGATAQAVRQQPSPATFQFRAKNQWINGGHNRSTIKSFYGAGQEDGERTKPFVFDADEPPLLLGEDHGANPVPVTIDVQAK